MENSNNNQKIIRNLDTQTNDNTVNYGYFFVFLGIAIVAGFIIGFILTKLPKSAQLSTILKQESIKQTVGITDKKTFKDKAEGTLKEGGIEGEGNFHLERPGGTSQNVYLTSSTVDLSLYLNKKVRVWGETFKGTNAGWLMDVGLVEILQ